MCADAAGGDKPVPKSTSTRAASHVPPPGVVVKSLAEIKREKLNRMQRRPDDTWTKTSKPAQRNQLDFKITLNAQRRGTALLDFTDFVLCFSSVY